MTAPTAADRLRTAFTPDVSHAPEGVRAGGTLPPTGSGADAWDRRRVALGYAAICVLALLSTLPSLRNGFAYDDVAIVLNNTRVHSLDRWWHFFREPYWPPQMPGGLYRPLVILMYAVLWKVGGGSPLPFHIASVAIYVACAAAVYRLMRMLVSERAAWVAAALFAVHPVHTECSANIVGVSEVITGLAAVLAVGTYLRARRSPEGITAGALAQIGALYVIGYLSKEHGFFLPGLIAVAELLAVDDPRPLAQRARALVPTAVVLTVLAAAWLAMRNTIPEVVNGARYSAVLGHYPWAVRLHTFLMVVQEWVRLLFWPARLSIDYSPQQTLIPTQWTWGQAGGVAVVLLVVIGGLLAARVNRRAAFALAWLGVMLAIPSGLLVATGYLLAERTLFLPSVGAMLIVGIVFQWLWARAGAEPRVGRAVRAASVAVVGALVAAGAWRSALRMGVWKDNETVFAQQVAEAPLSFRAHYSWGAWQIQKGNFPEGERQLRMAIALFDIDPEPREYLAMTYYANKLCEPAVPLLKKAMELRIDMDRDLIYRSRAPRAALADCYLTLGKPDSAASVARRSIEIDKGDKAAVRLLAQAERALQHTVSSGASRPAAR